MAGIRWISGKPRGLEFAGDVALLSHSFNHMQEKTQCKTQGTARSVRLRINKDKSKIMKVMTDCLQTVSLTKGPIGEV